MLQDRPKHHGIACDPIGCDVPGPDMEAASRRRVEIDERPTNRGISPFAPANRRELDTNDGRRIGFPIEERESHGNLGVIAPCRGDVASPAVAEGRAGAVNGHCRRVLRQVHRGDMRIGVDTNRGRIVSDDEIWIAVVIPVAPGRSVCRLIFRRGPVRR